MKWNSLLDSTPPERGRYLVYHWYTNDTYMVFWDGSRFQSNLIFTHWMPRPPAPEDANDVYVAMGHGFILATEYEDEAYG